MLIKVKITEQAIREHAVKYPHNLILRDTEIPLLQLRFHKGNVSASWRLLHNNGWHKVGGWPEFKTKQIRDQFSVLMANIRKDSGAKLISDDFSTCGELLMWYRERCLDDADLSDQRKADIKSAINCHLIPCLGDCNVDELTRNNLDSLLIWPTQKRIAKSSVAKVFNCLKDAYRRASKLQKIGVDNVSGIRINEFGDFSQGDSEHALTPRMIMPLLDELADEKPFLRVLVMLMLVLGTRIGETLKARWSRFSFGVENVWDIPAKDTKTKRDHTIYFPEVLAEFLKAWREYQKLLGYNGAFLFPNEKLSSFANYKNEIQPMIQVFSGGEWACHDLRRVARSCWKEQGVDFYVGETMLNHKVGKSAEAYMNSNGGIELRLGALQTHCEWLISLKNDCLKLNPTSALNDLEYRRLSMRNKV